MEWNLQQIFNKDSGGNHDLSQEIFLNHMVLFESEEENTVQIEVMISSEDLGKVIGKEGRIINAIRTIVQASSYIDDNKRVKINVDSF